jgi:hypothetical protein
MDWGSWGERRDFFESNHRHAAVDVDRLAGDVGGFGAGEEEDGGGDLTGVPVRAEGIAAGILAWCSGGSRPPEDQRDFR